MKAIVVDQSGNLRLVDDMPIGPLPLGHVRISILAGGVCGSDLHAIRAAKGGTPLPQIIGHEAGGRVVDVSPDVTSHRTGDIVVVEPNYVCMTCRWCRCGKTKMCDSRTVVSRDVPGLFSEYVDVPARFAWRLPQETPLGVLASLEPTLVARVAVDRMDVTSDAKVLIIGAGSQGQSVAHSLLSNGITPAVLDPNRSKLEAALVAGATEALPLSEAAYDVVFETSGTVPGSRTALESIGKLGRICLIGQTQDPVAFPTRTIVQKEITIQGSVIYNHPTDFASAITDYKSGVLDPRVGMREPVGPRQAVIDIGRADDLDGKIWIAFNDWTT